MSLIVYICFAVFFGGIMLLTLVLGGDADADVEIDADFDMDLDVDADIDGDAEVDGGGGFGHWFSLKVICAFGTAFGAGGAIAKCYDASPTQSLLIALASGGVLGFLVSQLLGFLYKQQATSSYSRRSLLGKEGSVTMTILSGSGCSGS